MQFLKRGRVALGITIASGFMMLAGNSAMAANPGAAVIQGSGTITPGVSTVPTFQHVTFSGSGAGALVLGSSVFASANLSCASFSGDSDIAETGAQGDGNVSGSCGGTDAATGAAYTIDCTATNGFNIHYQRVGVAVVITGSCGGTASVSVTGAFGFVPTSAPTTSSYLLAGAVVTR